MHQPLHTEIPQQPISSQPPVPTQPPIKNSNKLMLAIGIILLLIAAGSFAYFLYQTTPAPTPIYPTSPPVAVSPNPSPDEMSGWKTYHNAKYKYSFQYPAQYLLEEELPKYVTVKLVKDSSVFPQGEVESIITFNIEDREKKNSFSEAAIESLKIDCEAGSTDSSQHCDEVVSQTLYATAHGVEGLEVYLKLTLQRGPNISYLTKGPLYVFNLGSDNPSNYSYLKVEADYGTPNSKTKEILDQILSSFEFVKNDQGLFRVCPDMWVNIHSVMREEQKTGEFIVVDLDNDGVLEQHDPEKFDLNWIKENCEVNQPEDVG
ncbi:MAG: hypothetical protein UV59_C0012G0052 [Candidatus Gottesmanbacteria bacterium GW2011_GWA1_43_11]|uniref:Uncharacterized protein n=1 Tax=Candidatus Gottesmanbacteria bacterium GW2011_GWA1_43_11 TaxID=1618436 RepID=A0A0G1CHK0_9BACT|nr:MAG: hypothetical protein UV59_C0012G0052 [Candidatus Gottesmanbacteria bacterium GW2011_GWA1_43_11]